MNYLISVSCCTIFSQYLHLFHLQERRNKNPQNPTPPAPSRCPVRCCEFTSTFCLPACSSRIFLPRTSFLCECISPDSNNHKRKNKLIYQAVSKWMPLSPGFEERGRSLMRDLLKAAILPLQTRSFIFVTSEYE